MNPLRIHPKNGLHPSQVTKSGVKDQGQRYDDLSHPFALGPTGVVFPFLKGCSQEKQQGFLPSNTTESIELWCWGLLLIKASYLSVAHNLRCLKRNHFHTSTCVCEVA